MKKSKKSKNEPLTLDVLADYNQKVLLPALEERLVTKDGFKEFKNEMSTTLDFILKKLDILLTEKTVRDYQKKREKKMWLIVIKALKEHNILGPKQLKQIAQLEIF